MEQKHKSNELLANIRRLPANVYSHSLCICRLPKRPTQCHFSCSSLALTMTSGQWLHSVCADFTRFWMSLVNRILIGSITVIIGEVISGMFRIKCFTFLRLRICAFHYSNKSTNKHEQYNPSCMWWHCCISVPPAPPRNSRQVHFPSPHSRGCTDDISSGIPVLHSASAAQFGCILFI